MKKDILIVIRRGPYGGFQAAEGLRHANGATSLGFRPVVVLPMTASIWPKPAKIPARANWLALSGTLEEIVARGLYEKKDAPVGFYAEAESLSKRGLDPGELVEDIDVFLLKHMPSKGLFILSIWCIFLSSRMYHIG